MTRHVHVVSTGGTIGSVASRGTTDLDGSGLGALPSFAPSGSDVVFSESSPFRILSEDATPDHWTEIVRHVASLDMPNLDAIVIAHGSDTLAWTAKALAYGLRGCPKPVVLTGSDKPLSDPASNGPDNFRDAVSFAIAEQLPGVFVAWKNKGEPTSIHLATRVLPCDPYDDAFRSAAGLVFGTVSGGEFRREGLEGNPSRSHLAKERDPAVWTRTRRHALDGIRFERDMLVFPAMPGIDYSRFSLDGCKAAIQLAYHSGTAWSTEGDGSLVQFARRCREAGVPLVVGPCRHGRDPYASVERLRQEGAIFAPSMTESALVVKTRWIVANGLELSRIVDPLAFDVLPETTFRA